MNNENDVHTSSQTEISSGVSANIVQASILSLVSLSKLIKWLFSNSHVVMLFAEYKSNFCSGQFTGFKKLPAILQSAGGVHGHCNGSKNMFLL